MGSSKRRCHPLSGFNDASPFCRIQFYSLSASEARFHHRSHCTVGTELRRRRTCRRTRLPKVYRDGLHKPSRNPRKESTALPITHRRDWRLVPMKVRPDVGASLAAGLADKPGLEIRKPDVISPLFRADRDRMAAMIIRAIDEHATNAHLAHLGEGDLLRAGERGHAPLKRGRAPRTIS